MEAPSRERHRLRVLVVSLSSVAAALLLIAIGLAIKEDQAFWSGMLTNIGQTALVGGALSLAYEYFLREDMIRIQDESERRIISTYGSISEKFDLAEGCLVLGLSRTHLKEHAVDYSEILLSSPNLVMVFNDGRTWLSTHSADIAERMQKPNFKTTLVLTHPQSPFLSALAVKVESTEEHLRAKIAESTKMLSRLNGTGHKLRVVGHFMPTSYSLVMNDDRCIFVPYPISRKEDRIPRTGVQGGQRVLFLLPS